MSQHQSITIHSNHLNSYMVEDMKPEVEAEIFYRGVWSNEYSCVLTNDPVQRANSLKELQQITPEEEFKIKRENQQDIIYKILQHVPDIKQHQHVELLCVDLINEFLLSNLENIVGF